MEADFFDYFDERTGEFRQVWCPVRAVCLLLLLTVPIRSLQARLLDSGEADEEIYDQESGTWSPNLGLLVTPKRQFGVFRKIYDTPQERSFVGLHVTTNKTAAVTSANFEKGYDIPWDCPEIAPHLERLINWQKEFNPIKRLVNRRDFADTRLHPNEALQNISVYSLLFRDPASRGTHSDEPLTSARLRNFFLRLLEEAQRRLNEAGEE